MSGQYTFFILIFVDLIDLRATTLSPIWPPPKKFGHPFLPDCAICDINTNRAYLQLSTFECNLESGYVKYSRQFFNLFKALQNCI